MRDMLEEKDSAKENSAKENSAKENLAEENAAKENLAEENAAKENSAKENSAEENAATENSAKESAAKQEALNDVNILNDNDVKEDVVKNILMKDCLSENKLTICITLLLNIVISIGAVFLAKILQKVIDVAMEGNISSFARIITVSIAYIILLCIISYLYSLSSKLLIKDVIKILRERAFNGILNRNVQDFSKVNTADYISALTNDIKLIEENLIIPTLQVVQYGVMFIVTLILLFQISPLITLCLIGSLILMFIIPAFIGSSMQKRQGDYSKQLSVITSKLKDFFSGYEVIKSFQIGHYIKKELVNENNKTVTAKYKADKLFALNEGISQLCAYITQLSGLFIGAYFLIKGSMSAGTLVALIQLSGTFVSPVMMIMENIPKIKSIMPVMKRIEELSDYTDTSFTGTLKPTFYSSIIAKDLSFAYGESRQVLRGIDLTIAKGNKYAVVGKSGCGKSTLVKVLVGSYSTYNGSITFDGTSLLELDNQEVHSMASIIHQDIYMFDDSVLQNIYLYQDFLNEDFEEALNISGVSKFLDDMPEGVLQKVGENGSNLSGGQRQRVAVARALIRKNPILILDEGTSSIDTQTAYEIENSLLAIGDLTLITITHNLQVELLEKYDQIIYMEDGFIKEIGNLQELMAKQGEFYYFMNFER